MRRMAILGALLMTGLPAFAKIVDPPPLIDGAVTYGSHANYVEASDSRSGKLLWHTQLYDSTKPQHEEPGLERDVQWNIIRSLDLHGHQLRAHDSQGRVFCLDKNSGKVEDC